jgi:hypothetical protein
MRIVAGLCLLLAFGATAASAESPSPLTPVTLFKPFRDVRVWSLPVADEPATTVAREVRLTEFTIRTERDRLIQAVFTIGNQPVPSATRIGDVRGQALITVHMSFRALPLP